MGYWRPENMMPDTTRTRSRLATAAYVMAWLVAAALLAVAAIVLLGDDGDEQVSLPPLRETELVTAAREAGCELRRAGRGEQLNPPVDGAAATDAASAGFYESPLAAPSLTAAMREGLVVIHFRPQLDGDRVDELRTIQEAAPTGTIVTPNDSGMPFEVAVTAYRRLLGCRQASDESFQAVLLFRGRFVGSGPDS